VLTSCHLSSTCCVLRLRFALLSYLPVRCFLQGRLRHTACLPGGPVRFPGAVSETPRAGISRLGGKVWRGVPLPSGVGGPGCVVSSPRVVCARVLAEDKHGASWASQIASDDIISSAKAGLCDLCCLSVIGLFVCLSFCQQHYCVSNEPISLKLGVVIGPTSWNKWRFTLHGFSATLPF